MTLENTLYIEANPLTKNRIGRGITKKHYFKSNLLEILTLNNKIPNSISRKSSKIKIHFNGDFPKKSIKIPKKTKYFQWHAQFNPYNGENGYDNDFFAFYDINKNILNPEKLNKYREENGF